MVTCGLTACTPGSAAGPMLGNENGRTLPFTFLYSLVHVLKIMCMVSAIKFDGWTLLATLLCCDEKAEKQAKIKFWDMVQDGSTHFELTEFPYNTV